MEKIEIPISESDIVTIIKNFSDNKPVQIAHLSLGLHKEIPILLCKRKNI